MGLELMLALLGPIAGGIVGFGTFLVRRTISSTDARLGDISENVELIAHQVTSLQLKLAESYVTKDELIRHISSEERWQNQVLEQISDLRAEIAAERRDHSN